MPPRQEKSRRDRGKPPGAEDKALPKTPSRLGCSAINSPHTASTPQAQFGHQAQAFPPASSSGHVAARAGPSAKHSLPLEPLAPPGKVAIPTLKNPRINESFKGLKKGRTPHACDYCRKAKAGCTGGNPCTRCLDANVPCVYGDGKRDKDKKKITQLSREAASLSRHNDDITKALRRILRDAKLSSKEMRAALDGVLSMAPTPMNPDEEEEYILRACRDSSEADEEGEISGNEDLDMEVGSTGSLDVTNTNTDRDDTRATGHMGKSSSVAWAKRTADACQPAADGATTAGRSQPGLFVGSYHTEDADVELFDVTNINCFDWPEPEIADALIQSYFATVHHAFPIVDKINFMSQYNQFDRTPANLSTEDIIWLGTLNTIFAISAVHAHLTRSPNRGHYCDHLIYVARAKILCLDQGLLYEDARVHTTSALGLLCLYFISTCRLNRAWTVCGLAIRHALTLGLHVRSEASDISDYDKENRIRLWWSLYSLECLLNKLTGRPSCISDRDISTPLPSNINEEEMRPGQSLYEVREEIRDSSERTGRRSSQSPKDLRRRRSATYQMPIGITQPLAYTFPVLTMPVTTSTYFIYRTQLSVISHEIVTQLYCAATIKENWAEVQDTIKRIDGRLRAWRDNLPDEYTLDFDRWNEPDWRNPLVLPRLGLAMLFNSSRMILFRPCLCKFEGRMSKQSVKSMDFNQQGVQMCIHSARTMINLIGWTARDVEKIYAVTPWWHTLHYLCEALSVLMLELAYQAQHLPAEAAYMLDDAKKGIRWLIMMSEESISARKAWETFDTLIRLVAPKINWSVYDLPTTAPVPLGYNWRPPSGIPTNPAFPHLQTNSQSELPGFADLDPELDRRRQASNSSVSPWPPHTFGYQPSHIYAPTIYGQELVSNPMDQNRAIQMFGSIRALHGRYDEPWHYMFGASGPGIDYGIREGGAVGPPPPPAIAEQNDESDNSFAAHIGTGEFDPRDVPFEGMGWESGGGGCL